MSLLRVDYVVLGRERVVVLNVPPDSHNDNVLAAAQPPRREREAGEKEAVMASGMNTKTKRGPLSRLRRAWSEASVEERETFARELIALGRLPHQLVFPYEPHEPSATPPARP